jgi:phosphoribosyl-AMP cyclohydrolase
MNWIDELKYDSQGLIPVIVQDASDLKVLMFAWMNKQSLTDTVKTKKTHFWSRSRQKYWLKGEESGNFQVVKDIYFDCDRDVVLVLVDQVGGIACHTGRRSCFYNKVADSGVLESEPVLKDPKDMYKK